MPEHLVSAARADCSTGSGELRLQPLERFSVVTGLRRLRAFSDIQYERRSDSLS